MGKSQFPRLLPGTLKVILHKKQLKFYCVLPVGPVVSPGPDYIIMRNVTIE